MIIYKVSIISKIKKEKKKKKESKKKLPLMFEKDEIVHHFQKKSSDI